MFFPSNYFVSAGEASWDLTFRSRAYDNQFFVAVISPARDHSVPYVSYGHSYVADPYGQVVKRAGILEEIVTVDLGMSTLDTIDDSSFTFRMIFLILSAFSFRFEIVANIPRRYTSVPQSTH